MDAAVGSLCALGAFGFWGFMPVYFKAVEAVPPLEILAHRVVWSVVLVGGGLFLLGKGPEVTRALRNTALLKRLTVATLLLSGNWLLFIWAVTNEHILQGSLGYYINPLLNVLLGVALLKERLSIPQWTAIGLSAMGVLVLTFGLGAFPWIAIGLAMLFSLYGYVRKTTPIGAAPGLLIETLILLLPAVGYLLYLHMTGDGAFGQYGWVFDLKIAAAGIITAVPLVLFAAAALRLRYATVGVFQNITPTLHFLVGVFLYGEIFTTSHAITFGLIWVALAIYTTDTLRRRRGPS